MDTSKINHRYLVCDLYKCVCVCVCVCVCACVCVSKGYIRFIITDPEGKDEAIL